MDVRKESKDILSIIQKKGPLTKNNLLDITKMKLTSLNRLLKPLFEMKLIEVCNYTNETGGRPSALIDVNSHEWAVIGIDISRTYINLVLTSLKMDLIEQTLVPLDNTMTPEKIIDMLCKKILALEKKYSSKTILGIGIGVVGPIDKDAGILLNPERFPSKDWFNVDFKKPIEKGTHLPVRMESGANLAVLSEHYFGDAKHYNNVAYINCGVGIRSSVILSNKLLDTKNSREDTLAHMIVDYDGPSCTCGLKGCIDASSSIFSILKSFKNEVINNKQSTLLDNHIVDISYIDILEAAHKGDTLCKKIIDHAAAMLGIGISNYIKSLNLEYVILSGPLIQHSTYFYNLVLSTTLIHVQNSFSDGVLFNKGGSFKHNSIAIGGAAYYFETFLEKTL